MIRVIIEGSSNKERGDLRRGFHKLFSKALNSEFRFSIWMAGGKEKAVSSFLADNKSRDKFLLIDLDNPPEHIANEIKAQRLNGHEERVFFMIQEMEAWFLSQQDILQTHYKGCQLKIPKADPQTIKNPKSKLKEYTKHCGRKYHETVDGSALLEKLEPNRLANDFPDFDKLIKAFQTAL